MSNLLIDILDLSGVELPDNWKTNGGRASVTREKQPNQTGIHQRISARNESNNRIKLNTMNQITFNIKYKGVNITGSAYVDGNTVEIEDMDIDAIDLLGICDNNTLSTIEQLIIEDANSQDVERVTDRMNGRYD